MIYNKSEFWSFKTLLSCFLIFGLFSTIIPLTSCQKKSGLEQDYNIVMIVIDTLRADYLPFYGHKTMNSPFLSQLAKHSYIFENTYSASSWTTPSTASIFTSLYPFQHGTLIGWRAIKKKNSRKIPKVKINKIPDEISTVAEILKTRGYATYGIADNINISKNQGFTQGFDQFKTFSYKRARRVNKILKDWKDKILNNKKYFLYIHYMDPHMPYRTKEKEVKSHVKESESLSEYDLEIAYVDAHLKELYSIFNWEKNTLLLITSDHGEGFGEHGTFGHALTLYREEINVPLMIKLPNSGTAARIKGNHSTLDILPTICDFIGLPRFRDHQGISLMPYIKKNDLDITDRNIYSHLFCHMGKDKKNWGIDWKAVIHENWHYIYKTPIKKEEMYDLNSDKLETENLSIKNKIISRKLKTELMNFLQNCKKYKEQEVYLFLKQKRNQDLKTLGYL